MHRLVAAALLVAVSLLVPLAGHVSLAAALPPAHSQFVQRVIELVNVERQKVGLPPLTVNAALTRAAQDYSVVLADGSCFAHNCGSTLRERLDRAGYTNRRAWAENIAMGQATPEDVMAAWMSSSGHRGNILGSSYRDIGVGLAVKSTGQLVWVQDFGRNESSGSAPPPTATPVPPTATPTPTPEPPVACSPRPAFSVRTSRTSPGVLEVTVAAGQEGGAANNTLRALRFDSAVNARIEVSGRGQIAPGTTVTLAPGTRQATFTVRRITNGAATTVPLALTDACGSWPTFVGGGPSAF